MEEKSLLKTNISHIKLKYFNIGCSHPTNQFLYIWAPTNQTITYVYRSFYPEI